MKLRGWIAVALLTAAALLLLSHIFRAPPDLERPPGPASLVFIAAYFLQCALFVGVPAGFFRAYRERRFLQTVGLVFGVWAVIMIGMLLLGLLSSAAQGSRAIEVPFARVGELVVLCFAASGFFLFFENAAAGAGGRSRDSQRPREAMRARRHRMW